MSKLSSRKNFSPEYKANVALETERGMKTVNELPYENESSDKLYGENGRLKIELDGLKKPGSPCHDVAYMDRQLITLAGQ